MDISPPNSPPELTPSAQASQHAIASPTPTARRIAKTILNGFDAYFADFQNMTLGAKARFEKARWQAVQKHHRDRIELYKNKVNQVCELVEEVTSKDVSDLELWRQARTAYAQLVSNHSNYEIAETFFNSIFCSRFSHKHIHDRNMFVKPSRSQKTTGAQEKPLKEYSIYISYHVNSSLRDTITSILKDFEFSTPWENLPRDVQHILDRLQDILPIDPDTPMPTAQLDILESIFYRNKGAYLVGRAKINDVQIPFLLPFLNRKQGIYVDNAILDADGASRVFSFTRSYFMVDAPIPSRLVRFLSQLMPNKDIAEIYTSIGFNKHGKTEFYLDILQHMKQSNDQFEIAPGIKGMVMSVFTLPSYDCVFKVIKDRFAPPKTVTEAIVKDKYKLVSRSDRAGRMADTQEYTNFIFYRNRFSDELLEELKQVAASKLEINAKWVILKHVYTERRMIPLNMYLTHASDQEIVEVMDEYGNAIKQLAAANIFTGDMLLKNFGVTRHGRVVFYDYDEIMPITEVNFRKIPEPRNESEEMAERPWYTVAENDVFPEEFRLFFSGNPKAKQAFEKLHADIYDYRFWLGIQEKLKAGHIEDTFPYRRKSRFIN
jgi:isocitrate dehydrogenase kinase/phosphatase